MKIKTTLLKSNNSKIISMKDNKCEDSFNFSFEGTSSNGGKSINIQMPNDSIDSRTNGITFCTSISEGHPILERVNRRMKLKEMFETNLFEQKLPISEEPKKVQTENHEKEQNKYKRKNSKPVSRADKTNSSLTFKRKKKQSIYETIRQKRAQKLDETREISKIDKENFKKITDSEINDYLYLNGSQSK